MYTETLGRWHTVDLFVGLAYLSHREANEYPALDIAYRGRPVSLDQSADKMHALLEELKEIRRHLLYCRGLKYKKEEHQRQFWTEHLQLDPTQVLSQQANSYLLRPAYALLADSEMRCIVLCIRGTQNLKDLFTSLAATTKPHHKVQANGVVLGYSHLGMLAAARWLMKHLTPSIRSAMLLHPGYKLRLVGHSMGAGTAALLTTMLREALPDECGDARCYALACPACMTLELAQSCKDYVTTIINGTDIVPTFSAATVDTLREDVMHSSWFVEFQRDLRTSLFRTVQDGLRGMGSATQWTARNILQPPFRSCYPRSTPNLASSSSGNLAAVPVDEDSRAVAGPGAEAAAAAAGPQLQGLGTPAEWPQPGGAGAAGFRHSASGASVMGGGGGDSWAPASHLGGALSAQQLRRRLWPWGGGSGGPRERGYGDADAGSVGYDAAASMSYAGWLPDVSSGGNGNGVPLSHGAVELNGGHAPDDARQEQQQALLQPRRSVGGGEGVGTSGGGGGNAAAAYLESPSKRKSWTAMQGLTRWWSHRVLGGAGAGENDGAAPVSIMGMAGATTVSGGSVLVGEGAAQADRPSGSGVGRWGAAGQAPPPAPLVAAVVDPAAASPSWLLRSMFQVCTARRAHAAGRVGGSASIHGTGGASGGLDSPSGGLNGASPRGRDSEDDEDEDEAIDADEAAEQLLAGSGGSAAGAAVAAAAGPNGVQLLAPEDERQFQSGITAVVAAMTHEPGGGAAGAAAAGLREGELEPDLQASAAERALQEMGDGGSLGGMALDTLPSLDVGAPPPAATLTASRARKAQRPSSLGVGGGPGAGEEAGPGPASLAAQDREAGAAMAVDSPSGAMAAALLREQAQQGNAPSSPSSSSPAPMDGGPSAAAPKRHLYPAGRVLHLLPQARLSGLLGPMPATTDGPGPHLDPQAAADSVSRYTPTPPGMRANAAELASSRLANYQAPYVLFEVPDNQVYARIKLCRTMVLDHLTPAYLTALGSIMAQLEAQLGGEPTAAGARDASGAAAAAPTAGWAGSTTRDALMLDRLAHPGAGQQQAGGVLAAAAAQQQQQPTAAAATASAYPGPVVSATVPQLRQRGPIFSTDGDLL